MRCIYKWKQAGDLLLICMSSGELSEEQIAETNELHRSDRVIKGFAIVLGNPTMPPPVRKSLAAAMRDHKSYGVTDSAIARGIITAMNWLGNPMKACSPAQMREALIELGVPAGFSADQILEDLGKLQQEVEGELASRQSA